MSGGTSWCILFLTSIIRMYSFSCAFARCNFCTVSAAWDINAFCSSCFWRSSWYLAAWMLQEFDILLFSFSSFLMSNCIPHIVPTYCWLFSWQALSFSFKATSYSNLKQCIMVLISWWLIYITLRHLPDPLLHESFGEFHADPFHSSSRLLLIFWWRAQNFLVFHRHRENNLRNSGHHLRNLSETLNLTLLIKSTFIWMMMYRIYVNHRD